MTNREAVALFALAQQYFPTLKANSHTPDAWADILDDVSFDDARAALVRLCKRGEAFTSVGEIYTETRRVRHRPPYERTVAEALALPPAEPETMALPAGER